MVTMTPLRSVPAIACNAWRRKWQWVLGVVVALHAAPAFAQSTPTTSSPAQEPAARTRIIESAKQWAEEHQILARLNGTIDGWYPRLGGMTRGSGFGLGPGYRRHFLGDDILLDMSGALSTRLYKAVDIRARWLQTWSKRAELWTEYRFEDFPEEDFYGWGADSLPSTRTNYRFRGSDIKLRAQLKPISWLRTGAVLGYLHPSIGRGHDPEYPSIEQVFTDASVAGLASQPDFIHAQLFLDIDYRDVPGNPKRGGFYHLAVATWNDRTLDAYTFKRFDGNFSQFVPIARDQKHVISGRLGVSFTDTAAGDRLPFYFLPYVGGEDTIRSYREFRFKDEDALWFGAEYRWIPIKWVSGAVFADFGTVAPRWEDIHRANLKHGYGFGVRVHSDTQSFARIDFGFGGGEGRRIFIKLGPTF
jgi:hypothetical protein